MKYMIIAPNEYFQKIFCINLDRRTDRWDRCVEIFDKFNLSVERVSAIDGNNVTDNGKLLKNEAGCLLSHLGILNRMLSENIQRALILEDDVEFEDNWIDTLNSIIPTIPTWDMLYLGCNHVSKPMPFRENIVKLTRGYTTSSYAITREFAELMIPNIRMMNRQVDVSYANMHRANRCFAVSPSICRQRPGFSDIQGGHADYTESF